MSDPDPGRQEIQSPGKPERGTLDLERTRAALERTLLAWIRTALAFIGAGFTIVAVLVSLVEQGKLVGLRPHASRNLGLTLIGLGILSLLGAALQNRRAARRIAVPGEPEWTLGFALAILLALLGGLIFWGLLFRAGPF